MLPIINFTYTKIYKYDGWLFEYYRNKPFGPWPLNKDRGPRKRAGREFWRMFDKFSDLSEADQEKHRV